MPFLQCVPRRLAGIGVHGRQLSARYYTVRA